MPWILLALLLLPSSALAFGPVAHLDMGLDLVASATLFGAGVRRIIRRHSDAFLRGLLDPDRSLAKNLLPYRRHSHNWAHAFRQYETARVEEEKATFLGYLCHLAADTVAHNLYVPERLVASAGHPTAGHLYWESRFDARLRERAPEAVERLRQEEPAEHRRLLRRTVRNSLPGRQVQIRLTGIVLRVQGREGFGRWSVWVDRRSPIPLESNEVVRVRDLALAAQRQVLREFREAPIVALDPRGEAALRAARSLRGARAGMPPERVDALEAVLEQEESLLLQSIEGSRAAAPFPRTFSSAWAP